jgi:hypothetical protein
MDSTSKNRPLCYWVFYIHLNVFIPVNYYFWIGISFVFLEKKWTNRLKTSTAPLQSISFHRV